MLGPAGFGQAPRIPDPNTSWLNGKYTINGDKVEINVNMSTVAIDTTNGDEWFWQGDEADKVIDEIHAIWVNGDATVTAAIEQWINMYL